MARRKPEPARKLPGSTPGVKHRYRVTVAGPHRFYGARAGETVDIELTEKMLEHHVAVGVIDAYEDLDGQPSDPEGDAAENVPQDESRHDVVTLAADEGASITTEAGPEPEHK